MATSAPRTSQRVARDHGFHPVRIRRVVRETAEAASFVLDVPAELAATFAYEAGQFLTFRVEVAGEPHLRCYSMSSSPEVDDELQVTVKRVPGGAVSNRMIDTLAPGAVVEVTRPAGRVLPGAGRRRHRRLQRRQRHHARSSRCSRAPSAGHAAGSASSTPTATATPSSSRDRPRRPGRAAPRSPRGRPPPRRRARLRRRRRAAPVRREAGRSRLLRVRAGPVHGPGRGCPAGGRRR